MLLNRLECKLSVGYIHRILIVNRTISKVNFYLTSTMKTTVIKNTSVALAVMAVAAIAIWGFDQIAQLGVKALINLVG